MNEKNKFPSPIDASADAILARFEARQAHRQSDEGRMSKTHGEIAREADRLKSEKSSTPTSGGASSETERILLQAAETMGKAAEIQKQLSRGEYALDLPQTKEEQRRYIGVILDGIENSNRDCHDWSISTVVKNLEASLGKMNNGVAAEVKARLTVHDASELIKQAGGWIERDSSKVGPGYAIGSAATEADRRNHDLNRSVIEAFFDVGKEGVERAIPGLRIAEAWDWIQDACFNYRKFVLITAFLQLREKAKEMPKVSFKMEDESLRMWLRKEIKRKDGKEEDDDIKNLQAWLLEKGELPFTIRGEDLRELSDDEISQGRVESNFFIDSNSVRKAEVRKFLVDRLMKEEGLSRGEAEKSIQLAEKLAIASLETSVFNRTAQSGNDELAEIIGLKGWRKGRARTGRIRGPKATEMKIDGFGESWIRANMEEEKKMEIGVDKPLYAQNVDLSEIVEGDYVYFCTITVTRYHLLRKLLLDRTPRPWPGEGYIDKTMLQNAVVYFNTADKPILTKGEIDYFLEMVTKLKEQSINAEEAESKARKMKDSYLARKKCGPKKLRLWWLVGLVDVALSDINLKWGGAALGELARAVSREELSPDAGTFITQQQWDWIEKILKVGRRLLTLSGRRGLEVYTQKILGGQ